MDKVYDVIANILPIITIVILIILSKDRKRLRYFLFIYVFVCGCFLCLFVNGYGNIFWTIIVQVFFMFLYLGLCFVLIKKTENAFGKVYIIMCAIGYIPSILLMIYSRLKEEKKIEIESIDNLIVKIFSNDCIEMLKQILNNEWFKGVTVGVLGTVIGGLILDKITKNNNERK